MAKRNTSKCWRTSTQLKNQWTFIKNILRSNFFFNFFLLFRIDETEAEKRDRLNNWDEFLEKAPETNQPTAEKTEAKPTAEKAEVEQSTIAVESQ